MRKITISLILIMFLSLLSTFSLAVPHEINFQGVLEDNTTGEPVTAQNLQMTFSIYSDPVGGNPLWDETQTVTVEGGLYSVRLGSADPAADPIDPGIFNGDTRYLGVKVETTDEMKPRIPIISVPYAFRAEQLGGLSAEAFVKLGTSEAQETSETYGLAVKSTNSLGIGVYGETSGSASTRGVYGYASNSSGIKGYGVYGKSDCNEGVGVYGQTGSDNGYAGYFDGGMGIKIPVSNGPPPTTSTPDTGTMIYDETNNRLFIYHGGWRYIPTIEYVGIL